MKSVISVIILITALFSNSIFAGSMQFGEQDSLRKIQDIELTSHDGKALYLGYRLTTHFFLLSVYMEDQGYVFPIEGDENGSYYTLLPSEIADLQKSGVLPKPLPQYEITPLDYIFGYLLWVMMLITGLYYWLKKTFFKKKITKDEVVAEPLS